MAHNGAMASTIAPQPDLVVEQLLRVEALTVRFGPLLALDDVDFELRQGELVALAGENGAGKSTLVRCIAGDIAPTSGRILIRGQRTAPNPAAATRSGVAVVWQNLALCDNLDIAANLLLGQERGGAIRSTTRFHLTAAAMLAELGISLPDTSRPVGSLSGGQRQLLAVARALCSNPDLLILDEPTASLGVNESTHVEALTATVRQRGTTVLLASHDIDQMFRLADRIVVMRHGRVVAEVSPAETHPEDIVALISGQPTSSSARRQLSRLQGLADRLASADPSSSLSLILSALAGALETERVAIHLVDGPMLRIAGELGLPAALLEAWGELPFGAEGGPVGVAASDERAVVDHDVRSSTVWSPWRGVALGALIGSSVAVPVIGGGGLIGVISVLRETPRQPQRDELDLITLYAGYAASAVEREQLLGEVTARNRVLETIQEVLEVLAGPMPLSEGLVVVLAALCDGLQADEVALLRWTGLGCAPEVHAVVDAAGVLRPSTGALLDAGTRVLNLALRDAPTRGGRARVVRDDAGGSYLSVTFPGPAGPSALLARWGSGAAPTDATALLEDAGASLRLAHERQEAERARQEASALRRSQELQRGFLSRLSHELRTPLTAIRGYASSLLAPDVTWDSDSEERFLTRIAAESARLGRLVNDLLDFSAIESSTLRLAPDWCDLGPVIDASVACLPPDSAALVTVECAPELPVVWADHDRLEQVFLNLLENAFRHNPPGTRVRVEARANGGSEAIVSVTDDGSGAPVEIAAALGGATPPRRGPTAGAGLGLSIARGIVDVHGGTIELAALDHGTRFEVRLPVDHDDGVLAHGLAEDHDPADV
jgi:signal transduction histidine kinase/ABC-type multidrug transport system ATPase subunit